MRFKSDQLEVSPFVEDDTGPVLEMYAQSEDFLALGPVVKASKEMVLDDIEDAHKLGGQYCVIRHETTVIGVVAYIATTEQLSASYLLLLMIGAPWRNRGHGRVVVDALERYLWEEYGTESVNSAVQVNNPDAIRFYKRIGFQFSNESRTQPDGTVTFEMSKELDVDAFV